jgi:putative ABC transport system substrate-binding protein
MRRRTFIAMLGTAALASRFTYGQAAERPVIGVLSPATREGWEPYMAAFRSGLGELGYVEGQNVAMEYRWEAEPPRVAARELVQRRVTVIAALGAIREVMAETTDVPIVSTFGFDPVDAGLVTSLSRPGGNVTGVYFFTFEIVAKRLQLLREAVPNATHVGLLLNPTNRLGAEAQARDAEIAAGKLGMRLHLAWVSSEDAFAAAFADLAKARVDVLIVGADVLFNSKRRNLVALAASHAIPAIYEWREFADAGGLMSYGLSITAAYRQAGVYVGRILKGERAGDLPIQSPSTLELVINLKAARAMGLEIPSAVFARADEVIE